MHSYPKNRRYVIIPANKANISIGNFSAMARKSIAENFIIWDYPEKDRKLIKLKQDPSIKILTHDEALKLMAAKEWDRPGKSTKF